MPKQPSRRDVLKASIGGAVVGLSGCLSGSGDKPDTETTTTTTDVTPDSTTVRSSKTVLDVGESFTTEDGLEITVEGVRQQCSTYFLDTPDTLDVLRPDGTQFLYASVRVSASDSSAERPPKDAFRVIADGVEYPAKSEVGGVKTFDLRPGFESTSEYGTDKYRGWVVFAPAAEITASSPEITLQVSTDKSVSWTIDDETVERLVAPPPEFSVEKLEPPESVPADEHVTVPVTVANAGGGATFRSSFNRRDGSASPVRFEFSVGTDQTTTHSATLRPQSDADRVTYSFASASLDRDFTVERTDS